MLATLLLFLTPAMPTEPAIERQEWALELTIETSDQRITLRLPADDYAACEELRDVWLVDGPRDREGFESRAECVEVRRDGHRHH